MATQYHRLLLLIGVLAMPQLGLAADEKPIHIHVAVQFGRGTKNFEEELRRELFSMQSNISPGEELAEVVRDVLGESMEVFNFVTTPRSKPDEPELVVKFSANKAFGSFGAPWPTVPLNLTLQMNLGEESISIDLPPVLSENDKTRRNLLRDPRWLSDHLQNCIGNQWEQQCGKLFLALFVNGRGGYSQAGIVTDVPYSHFRNLTLGLERSAVFHADFPADTDKPGVDFIPCWDSVPQLAGPEFVGAQPPTCITTQAPRRLPELKMPIRLRLKRYWIVGGSK